MASKLKLLGQFELITTDDKPLRVSSKNGQIIIAMLALEKDLCITREKLIGKLWATRSEQQARNSLRQILSSLRKTFRDKGLELLNADYSCVQLLNDQLDIDVLHSTDSIQGLSELELESLVKLYRGEFLENLSIRDASIQSWLQTQRLYFSNQKNEILSQLVELYYRNADYEKAICTGNRLLDDDPLNENIHRLMIQAFSAIGDRVAASKQYQHCSQLLEAELSISPSKKTTDIYTGACKNSFEGKQLYSSERQRSMSCEFPGNPAIAILPFKNINQSQQQDSLCDGLTEDITTHLSKFRDLLVITSSSTFLYKDSKMKSQEIAEKLKVEYILEGSVQKVASRVRISTQLIDASNGVHLWSEIYDRQVDQTHQLQDEVAQMIVGTLASVYGGRLRKAWQKQNYSHQPVNVRAFDYFTRAIDCANAFTKSKNKQARHYFEKAIEIDPDYAKAYSGLACTHLLDAVEAWKDDYETCMQNCLFYANKAIDCDDSESWSYWQLAVYFIYTLNHDLALLEFEKAIQLNPNDADVLADVGYYFSYCGNSDKALEYAQKAMRLNPHYPDYYLLQLGQIFFDAHQYTDAISMFRKSHRTYTALAGLYLAASHAALGQSKESTTAIKQVMSLDHNASLKKWTDRRLAPYKFRKDLDHFRHHLESAGLS